MTRNTRKNACDIIGELKTSNGWGFDTTTALLQKDLGYAYDAAWNLIRRTNITLGQTFAVAYRPLDQPRDNEWIRYGIVPYGLVAVEVRARKMRPT